MNAFLFLGTSFYLKTLQEVVMSSFHANVPPVNRYIMNLIILSVMQSLLYRRQYFSHTILLQNKNDFVIIQVSLAVQNLRFSCTIFINC